MSIADISFAEWVAKESRVWDGPTMHEAEEMRREYHDELLRREREGRWPVADRKDPENTELLEILLCPSCENELGSAPCAPVHALLQDHPEQHPLILPLVEAVVHQTRHDETKLCPVCDDSPPVATGDCPHVVDRFGQIWMSKTTWEKLVHGNNAVREELDDLENVHADYMESVRIERKRLEEDRQHWAATWATEKFTTMCDDKDWSPVSGPTREFQREFLRRLEDDE